jgi:hypothetical protein
VFFASLFTATGKLSTTSFYIDAALPYITVVPIPIFMRSVLICSSRECIRQWFLC